jgi:hypothetical protein
MPAAILAARLRPCWSFQAASASLECGRSRHGVRGGYVLVLALATMLGYCAIMLVFPILARQLPKSHKLHMEVQIATQQTEDRQDPVPCR